jgi:hypothetical protein
MWSVADAIKLFYSMMLPHDKLECFVTGKKAHLLGVQFEQILTQFTAKKIYKIVPSSVR